MGRVRSVVKARWPFCLVLGLAALALYLPTLTHDFVNYDDQEYITENRHVRAGLTTAGTKWAFGEHADNWHPLTWLSHMLDCEVYGLRPWGHHLTNALLHAANAVLLFLALNGMTGSRWRSAAVAALFAWHPLHVESVAWVSERKDVLSGFFFFLTILAYRRYVGGTITTDRTNGTNRSTVWYLMTLLLFALGLMSKPMLVTVPFVLLLLDFWPLNRLSSAECQVPAGADARPEEVRGLWSRLRSASARQAVVRGPVPGQWSVISGLLLEKLPFLALSAGSCLLTLSAQHSAMLDPVSLSWPQRVQHTIVAYGHYLKATFLPVGLAVYYPYQQKIPLWEVLAAGSILAAISWFCLRPMTRAGEVSGLRDGWLFTGWFWFVGMLVPVIGLVQVGDQAWADRYSYLPSVGLFVAIVWGLAQMLGVSGRSDRSDRSASIWRQLALGASVLLLAACPLFTLRQLGHWRNTRTLFEHTAQVTERNPLAAEMLAGILDKEGKVDQAIALYRAALSYAPKDPFAHYLLGHAYEDQGKLDQAAAEYGLALPYARISDQAHVSLGALLARQNQKEAAAQHYLIALRLNPESAVAHNNLGLLLHGQGQLDQAMDHYRQAVEFDPEFAQAHNNLGIVFLQRGRLAEGTAQLRDALRLRPNDAQTKVNLARALVQQRQWGEAASLFSNTVTSATTDPNLHYQYALALAHLRKLREAMSQYAGALLLRQDFPDALDGLSWILATAPDPALRNGVEATRMAARACELTGRKDAVKLRTLAAAYAETGQFADAQATINSAIALQSKAGDEAAAGQSRLLLEQFKNSRPWREEP